MLRMWVMWVMVMRLMRLTMLMRLRMLRRWVDAMTMMNYYWNIESNKLTTFATVLTLVIMTMIMMQMMHCDVQPSEKILLL